MVDRTLPESQRLGFRLKETPIAIVGVGGIFPGARHITEFWEGLKSGYDGTSRVPPKASYWEEHLFVKPRTIESPVGVPHSIAGYLPEMRFDPTKYGMTPKSLAAISSFQLYSLLVAEETLRDAGWGSRPEWERIRDATGVILATSGMGSLGYEASKQLDVEHWRCVLRDHGIAKEQTEEILAKVRSTYPSWQENTFPGLLPNICAGRIANRFDLKGPNYTVDAACAASMAAIRAAILELISGSVDAVLTGAANVDNSVFAFLCYEEVKALSRSGKCRPFDASADGMILGDAVGMVLLKRLPDAERDGDKIYALIRGIGAASDGMAKSIYAPHWQGQVDAMQRAYGGTGLSPADVTVIEMHGTGTPVGDPVEAKSIKSVYEPLHLPSESIAIGSVKSQIGHTRLAAGMVSTIKMALALSHKQIPATIHVSQINPKLGLSESPFYVNTNLRPWVVRPGTSRKAGINAFGFGGTNFHLVMEEYTGIGRVSPRVTYPQVAVFAAENTTELFELLKETLRDLAEQEYARVASRISHFSSEKIPPHLARLCVVVRSWDELKERLAQVTKDLEQNQVPETHRRQGVFYSPQGIKSGVKTVILHPGQGTQSVNMGLDLVCNQPHLVDLLCEWDECALERGLPRISSLLYPVNNPSPGEGEKESHDDIHLPDHAQFALGFVHQVLTDLLKESGLKADFALGHSFGEVSALHTAGILDDRAYRQTTFDRATSMAKASDEGKFSLLAVSLAATDLRELIAAKPYGQSLHISCINAPEQTVVGGLREDLEQLKADLSEQKIRSVLLKVGHAFHTPYMAAARREFAEKLPWIEFSPGRECQPLSCKSGSFYPSEADVQKELLADQLVSTVEFQGMVESVLKQSEKIIFVEIGPKTTLTQLVKSVVGESSSRDIRYLASTPNPDKSWTDQFVLFLAELCCLGLARPGSFAVQLDTTKPRPESSVTVTIDGGVNYGAEIDQTRKKVQEDRPFPTIPPDSVQPQSREGSGQIKDVYPPRRLSDTLCEIQSDFLHLQNKLQAQLNANSGDSPRYGELQQSRDRITAVQMKFLDQLPGLMGIAHEPQAMKDHASQGRMPKESNPKDDEWKGQSPAPNLDSTQDGQKTFDHPPAALQASRPATPKDPAAIQELMIKIVHEKTGYPRDLIKMDQDIETDLGIDSIKRLEILSEMVDHFPEFSLDTLEESQITHLRTLGQIHGFIAGVLAGPAPTAKPLPPTLVQSPVPLMPAHTTNAQVFKSPLVPYGVRLTPTPVSTLDHHSGQGQTLVVFGFAQDSWLKELCARLQGSGYEPILVLLTKEKTADSQESAHFPVVEIGPQDDLDSLRDHFFGEIAKSQVGLKLIFVAPSGGQENQDSVFDYDRLSHMSEAIFRLTQALVKKDAPPVAAFLSVSVTDGCLGTTGHGDFIAMGLGGFVKSVVREHPHLPMRHVDIGHHLSIAEKHAVMLQELAMGSQGLAEVGRRDVTSRLELGFEQRTAPTVITDPTAWTKDDVILVTGGGRGITADCLAALAQSHPAHYVIFGRTELTNEPEWAQGISDEINLKQRIAEHLARESPGFQAKAVKDTYHAICRQRAIKAQLDALKALGAHPHYRCVDIADKDAVQTTIAEVQHSIGKVTGLIHGAGIALDRKLSHKSFPDFERVTATKIKGLLHLLGALEVSHLRRMVLFSSISAVVGNIGQTDYAFANGLLNGLAYRLGVLWPKTQVSAIAWGPWNGGLVDSTLRQFFEKRGIPMIPPDEGSASFVQTFLHPEISGPLTLVSKELHQAHYERLDAKTMGFGS